MIRDISDLLKSSFCRFFPVFVAGFLSFAPFSYGSFEGSEDEEREETASTQSATPSQSEGEDFTSSPVLTLHDVGKSSSSRKHKKSKSNFYDDKPSRINMISLDGGGLRGIILARLLQLMEADLEKEFTKSMRGVTHKPDLQIAECFHIASGTSTGGIIVLGASLVDQTYKVRVRPSYTTDILVDLYETKGDEIFTKSKSHGSLKGAAGPKYHSTGLERLLNFYFGDVELGSSLGHIVVPAVDMATGEIYPFDSRKAETQGILMKHVALATSAAPSFFPRARFKVGGEDKEYIDGGVLMNNPSLLAYSRGGSQKSLLISIGTGELIQTKKPFSSGFFKIFSPFFNKDGGYRFGLTPQLISFMMDGTIKMLDDALNERAKNDSNLDYRRIQIEVPKKFKEMDDPKNVPFLKEKAEKYYQKHENTVFMPLIKELATSYLKGDALKQRITRHSDESQWGSYYEAPVLDLSFLPLELKENRKLLQRILTEKSQKKWAFKKLDLSHAGLRKIVTDLVTTMTGLEDGENIGRGFQLTLLNLSHNVLIPRHIHQIRALIEGNKIKKLDLSYVGLNSYSFEHILKALEKPGYLENLNLYGNRELGKKELRKLVKVLSSRTPLRYLNIIDCLGEKKDEKKQILNSIANNYTLACIKVRGDSLINQKRDFKGFMKTYNKTYKIVY